jgi:HTH-type transcriptional regulator/antitoxin HigA
MTTAETRSLTEYPMLLVKYAPRPIMTQRDYRRALKEVEQLMEPHPSKAKSQLIDVLSTLIVDYEGKRYPSTSPKPHEVLAHLIEAREVSQAEVANATGIPRSTISGILAARRGMSNANIKKIAAYFRVSPAIFLESESDNE